MGNFILATQNMDSFKSKHFDFYANAQYPLIMKQQTMAELGLGGKRYKKIKVTHLI